jgi:exodeoxyribonuclease V alpha subunit
MLRELNLAETLQLEGKAVPADFARLDPQTLLIIDEASMVDLGQWMQLTTHVELYGSNFVMTGDVAQLPPIGPGIVFHKLAQMDDLTARLKTIHRQSESSGIPQVALSIRKGSLPCFQPYDGIANGVSLVDCHESEIDRTVLRVVADLGGFSAMHHDLQIVGALNRTVERLNSMFHNLRRSSEELEVRGHLGSWFSPGDPIVYLENDYKLGLFNGMLGHVSAVEPERRSLTARFDKEEYRFDSNDLIKLRLAYSLTCHKLQGSQAKRVIIIVEPSRIIEPTWLYTAVTRAESQAVFVGPLTAIQHGLCRPPAFRSRVAAFAHELEKIGDH